MKKTLRNSAVVLCIFALFIGLLTGCLQPRGGSSSQAVNKVAQAEEIDPVQWYETVRWQSVSLVKELLERGADPDQIFFSGETALHFAVEQGNYELAQLLLGYGADVNIQERKEGFTPLMYAGIKDDQKMMTLLTSHGADPTAPDIDGYTTYHYLAARGNKVATQLLAGTAPVPEDLPTKDGLTVADIASLSKKTIRITLASANQY